MPKPSSDLPESGPGRSLLSVWSCSGWGLHSPSRYRDGGSLLHCHSTLTRRGLLRKTSEDCLQSSGHIAYNPSGRYYFCCTGLGVTSTGCYPASCPAEPGLSSSAPFRLCSRDHLFHLFLLFDNCLYFKTASADELPAQGIFWQLLAADSQKILQKLEQPFCLMIFRLPLLYAKEQRLRILF